MATATDTTIRDATLLLLVLAAVACGTNQATFEELYGEGYRELESGNLDVARTAAEEGLRRAESNRRSGWARAFGVLDAEILVAQRRIPEALQRLNAGIVESTPVDIVGARALMTRGYAECFADDDENADSRSERDLEEAAEIAASLDAGRVVAEVILRRGTCARRRGDLDTAEAHFRDAIGDAERWGFRLIEAQAAGGLGLVLLQKSQFDAATQWLRRSLDVVPVSSAGGLRAKTLGNLGWCYYLLGDYERAVQVLSQAEAIADELGYVGDQVIALRNLGGALQLLGRFGAANESYDRAAAVALEIQNRREAVEALANIRTTQAALALEQKRYSEAASRSEEALRIQIEHGLPVGRQRTLLLQGEIWERRGKPSRAAALYNGVIEMPDAEPDLLWEARAALARLHARADRPAEAETEFMRAFELMEISRTQLLEADLQLPFVANLGRFYDEYVSFLVAQGRVVEALHAADDTRARLLQERLLGAGAHPVRGIASADLARDIDGLLLFYWTAPDRSFLWAVTNNGIELIPLPEEEVLDSLVTAYQERILRSRDPIGEGDPEGRELYRLLIQPVSALMAAAERVVVAPDGPLHRLNFETLVVPDSEPHYLIEDTTLERTPSLRLLSDERTSGQIEAPSLLVLGDPISPSEEFPTLPFAGREIANIAELFAPENRRVYSQGRANRSAYLSADLERFKYVHLAAHAQANLVVPLDSAVVLSARGDDYKLYAREIVSVPLNAELVTLSACRGAGARTFAGEGLVGLSWAFLSAGARHVIGGLWQVEDASTAELMTHLYRELMAGAEPAVALRRAKLELLRSDTAYRKPYYWAPFVVYASRAGGSRQ